MENHQLRSILLELQDSLSDHDRQRLHSSLANDVPSNINEDTQSALSSRKQSFWSSWFRKKCFFLPLILFLLTLAILIVVVIQGKSRIECLQANLQILSLKNNAEIEQRNKTLIESIYKRKTLLIKAGRKFGGVGGRNFDDSSASMFTTAHYLSGIVYSGLNELESCQFIYSSSHDNQSRLESKPHGRHGAKINSIHRYYLDDDERIEQVFVKSNNVTLPIPNSPPYTTKLVIGLQFVTTKGRIIPPIDVYEMDSAAESERIPGYILGYATGRDGLRIDRLQFFWYRIKTEQ